MLSGGLIVFGVLASLSIGLPFLLAGLALLVALQRREAREGRGVRGAPLALGAAIVLLPLGVLNLDNQLGAPLLGLGLALVAIACLRCKRREPAA
jgi:heme A synthase